MKALFKITSQLRESILEDLSRSHPFAAERVGFISCRAATTPSGLLVLAANYHSVADEDYLPDLTVGAMMGPGAIRKALQLAYNSPSCMFHIHLHDHDGSPKFSTIDLRENAKFVPDFFNVQPSRPHGALVLSRTSAIGRYWMTRRAGPQWFSRITFVGSPLFFINYL